MVPHPSNTGKLTNPLSPPRVLGRHWLIEFYDCPPERIDSTTEVGEAMLAAARKAEASIVSSNFHQFNPHGVSGVVIIQESHLTIHTWPEYGFAALDIFTCGKAIRTEPAIQLLREAFGAGRVEVREFGRGAF